ncbi:MAG: type II toxin-antitoxin system VapC family toxin [Verrucomicrobia bacterium]|nr:type II toxin-antitoxin system VapC family toxin [Verrucomicrobiota bacterium]MCH8513714.1 type II toxin-antitoxin system VapC family toxin [Kiritimatiellia bacterium]
MYLLDTHTLLWASGQPEQLSNPVREILLDSENVVYVSMVTLWELSIKQSIGKLTLPEVFFSRIFETGYSRLDITETHLSRYRALPLFHRDPFDRLLVAQAQSEDLILLSRDAHVQAYHVRTRW